MNCIICYICIQKYIIYERMLFILSHTEIMFLLLIQILFRNTTNLVAIRQVIFELAKTCFKKKKKPGTEQFF